MTHGRIGKGSTSHLTQAAPAAKTTAEQRALVSRYRKLTRELDLAEGTVRHLNDEIDKTVALLRRGVTVTRLMVLLRIPAGTHPGGIRRRIESGKGLLDPVDPIEGITRKTYNTRGVT